MKKRSLAVLSTTFIFLTHLLFGLNNPDIADLAKGSFSRKTPGIKKLIATSPENKGASFELESALLVSQAHEQAEGFDLAIIFENNEALIFTDYETPPVLLKSTEFDLITKRFAFECKGGGSIHEEKCLEQLLKEQLMLDWMKKLAQELDNETLHIRLKRHTATTTFLTLKSPSTLYRPISLAFSWIGTQEESLCIKQLIKIIKMLATKNLLAFFKTPIPHAFKLKLQQHAIDYVDNMSL